MKAGQPLLTFFRRRCLPPAQIAICAAPATVNTSAGRHWVPMEKKICKMRTTKGARVSSCLV